MRWVVLNAAVCCLWLFSFTLSVQHEFYNGGYAQTVTHGLCFTANAVNLMIAVLFRGRRQQGKS